MCKIALAVLAGLALLFTTVPAWAVTTPGFPAIGLDDGPSILITLNPNGTLSTTTNSNPPFDGVEDAYVGVINNSTNLILNSLNLTGSSIFAFDGDGIGTNPNPTSGLPGPPGGPFGPAGYEGPGTLFSNIVGVNSGTVNFTRGLQPGEKRYFSLEGTPNSLALSVTPVIVPEPASVVLGGLGGVLLFLYVRRRHMGVPLAP